MPTIDNYYLHIHSLDYYKDEYGNNCERNCYYAVLCLSNFESKIDIDNGNYNLYVTTDTRGINEFRESMKIYDANQLMINKQLFQDKEKQIEELNEKLKSCIDNFYDYRCNNNSDDFLSRISRLEIMNQELESVKNTYKFFTYLFAASTILMYIYAIL
jgi:hypothetical protein